MDIAKEYKDAMILLVAGLTTRHEDGGIVYNINFKNEGFSPPPTASISFRSATDYYILALRMRLVYNEDYYNTISSGKDGLFNVKWYNDSGLIHSMDAKCDRDLCEYFYKSTIEEPNTPISWIQCVKNMINRRI